MWRLKRVSSGLIKLTSCKTRRRYYTECLNFNYFFCTNILNFVIESIVLFKWKVSRHFMSTSIIIQDNILFKILGVSVLYYIVYILKFSLYYSYMSLWLVGWLNFRRIIFILCNLICFLNLSWLYWVTVFISYIEQSWTNSYLLPTTKACIVASLLDFIVCFFR